LEYCRKKEQRTYPVANVFPDNQPKSITRHEQLSTKNRKIFPPIDPCKPLKNNALQRPNGSIGKGNNGKGNHNGPIFPKGGIGNYFPDRRPLKPLKSRVGASVL
jgi:hypothetical protein